MAEIFPTASQLRNDGRNYLIILNEVRAIENAVLLASDSGLMDCQVYNTYMTNITLENFQNVTSISGNSFIKNSHGLSSGDEIELATTGILPSPLLLSRTYYVIVDDINTFRIADSFLDTINNNNIDILDSGTGTMKFRRISPAQKYWDTWQGTRIDRPMIQQMNAVMSHFVSLGYSIKRVTNTSTNATFLWSLVW